MNGRIYDPLIGRFVSPDPYIQDPNNLQNYNRYSYVWNNPLGYTDPSGYWNLGKAFAALFAPITNKEVFRAAVTIAVAYAVGDVWAPFGNTGLGAAIGNGAAGGFAGGFVGSGGNFNAGLNGAFTGGLFGAIGYQADVGKWSDFDKIAAHAGAGCISAAAGGGDCGSGALSAGFGKFASLNMPDAFRGNTGYELTYVAVVGGTASVLGGGKFANGAETAAFGYLFNQLATKQRANWAAPLSSRAGSFDGTPSWSSASGQDLPSCEATAACIDGVLRSPQSGGDLHRLFVREFSVYMFDPRDPQWREILLTGGGMGAKIGAVNLAERYGLQTFAQTVKTWAPPAAAVLTFTATAHEYSARQACEAKCRSEQ